VVCSMSRDKGGSRKRSTKSSRICQSCRSAACSGTGARALCFGDVRRFFFAAIVRANACPNSEAIVAAPLPDLPLAGLTPSRENEKPILCIAGRSFLDEAAAALFAQILEKHGMGRRLGLLGH